MIRKQKGNALLYITIIVCVLIMAFSAAVGTFIGTGWYIADMGSNVDFEETEEVSDIALVNILFIGLDDEGANGLADTIMLVSINGVEGTINVLSIPRDTRTQFGNRFGKINEGYDIGHIEVRRGNLSEPEDLLIRKVRELTGLPVHYFVSLKMEGFSNVIDILGGVEIDVPHVPNAHGFRGMLYEDPTRNSRGEFVGARIRIPEGPRILTGNETLGFIRFRSYPDGDLGRIRAQQMFISALVEQHLNARTLGRINQLFGQMYENVRTNFAAADLIRYALLLRDLDPESIQTFQLPGSLGYVGSISYFIPNLSQLETLINEEFLLRPAQIDYEYYENSDE